MNLTKMISYDSCPCCGQKDIAPALVTEDYTVSHERFEIWECKICTLRFTQNIPDESGIGAYYQSEDYISHTDSNEGLVNRLYHKVRKRTLIQKRKLVEATTGKVAGSILDVGSGTGAFLHTMQEAGWQTTGLEPDEGARVKAKDLYQLQLRRPGELFSLIDGSFDAITLWHVLEHVHELHAYIKRLKELLAPGGILFIAVPNYTCYDAKIYKEYWAAYDVPRHLYHFSPASVNILLSPYGLQVRSIKPMWFDSFYVSMLSEKYKTGKSHFIKGVINGGISNWKALVNIKKCSSVIYIVSGKA